MMAYNSHTGTIYSNTGGKISINASPKYSAPVIKDQTGVWVYFNPFDSIVEVHQHGKIIYTEPAPAISFAPTIKEEKRIEKRTDQTYTDILELFSEHQEQSEAEEEQINDLSIKYFLEGDIK